MLSVFETGEASFRLVDGNDANVGWIRGSALGFGGFATEEEAIAAGEAGGDALAAYLERAFGAERATGKGGATLRVVHDGAYEWVARGSQPLARLFRPGDDSTEGHGDADEFRVEFVLPSYVRAGAMISAAQQLHRAIMGPATPAASVAAARPDSTNDPRETSIGAR